MLVLESVERFSPAEFAVSLSPAVLNEILLDIAEAARGEWIRIAQRDLFSTRRDYVNGIQQVRSPAQGQAVISLLGELPNLIEQGMAETDLHKTLLGPGVPVAPRGQPGKRARAAGGYYRAVPFSHAGPTSTGAGGQPLGRPYSDHDAVEDAQKLGRMIQRRLRKLTPTTSEPGAGTQWGGRLPAGLAPKLREYHATDIYAGAVRQQKRYRTATQSTAVSFRTIAVDATGRPVGKSPWIRPATQGREFVRQVNEYVAQVAPRTFEAYVKGLQR